MRTFQADLVEGVEDAYAFAQCAPSTSSTAKSKVPIMVTFDFFDTFAKMTTETDGAKFAFFGAFNLPPDRKR